MSPGGEAAISDSTFEGNQAVGGSGGTGRLGIYSIGLALGGAIENEGVLVVDNSHFTNNWARGGSNGISYLNVGLVGVGGGGAIANVQLGTATICRSTMSGNQAEGGAGNKGKLGPYFVGSGIGGGIANLTGGKLHIHECKFVCNKAQGGSPGNTGTGSQGAGGGLITFAAATRVQDSRFDANQAQGLTHEFLMSEDEQEDWIVPSGSRRIQFWDTERFQAVRWGPDGGCIFDNSRGQLP